jgi:hypothetical protein
MLLPLCAAKTDPSQARRTVSVLPAMSTTSMRSESSSSTSSGANAVPSVTDRLTSFIALVSEPSRSIVESTMVRLVMMTRSSSMRRMSPTPNRGVVQVMFAVALTDAARLCASAPTDSSSAAAPNTPVRAIDRCAVVPTLNAADEDRSISIMV